MKSHEKWNGINILWLLTGHTVWKMKQIDSFFKKVAEPWFGWIRSSCSPIRGEKKRVKQNPENESSKTLNEHREVGPVR